MERERAIEIVKKHYSPDGVDDTLRRALETLIPELAESEDEIHRKWILEYLYDGLRKSDEQFKGQFKSAIDWLEKQKEQSTGHKTYDGKALSRSYDLGYRKGVADAEKEMYEESGYTPDESRAYDHGYENGYNDGKDEAKQKPSDLPAGFYFIDQDGRKYYSKEFSYNNGTFTTTMKVKKEQKPDKKQVSRAQIHHELLQNGTITMEEYLKLTENLYFPREQKPVEYLPKQKVFDIMNKLTNLSYSERIPIESEEYVKIHEITSDVNSLLNYPIKPVEWSEDDEKMRNALWNLLKIQYAQDNSMTGVGIEAGKFRDWLNSLPKIEWSEEDKEKLDAVINFLFVLDSYIGDDCTISDDKTTEARDAIQKVIVPWLKSLRPSWKPSEEQMKAFKGYIEDFQARAESAVGGWNNFDVMICLYEQLKKLI